MPTSRDSSPTPAAAAAATKEAEEQALLPYKWTQTIQDVDVTVPVAATLRGRDLLVEIEKMHLKVGVKGEEGFIIDVCLFSFFFLAFFWAFFFGRRVGGRGVGLGYVVWNGFSF